MANDKEDADILDSLEREAKEFDKVQNARPCSPQDVKTNPIRMPKSTVSSRPEHPPRHGA
jgi:hypothetical protein